MCLNFAFIIKVNVYTYMADKDVRTNQYVLCKVAAIILSQTPVLSHTINTQCIHTHTHAVVVYAVYMNWKQYQK